MGPAAISAEEYGRWRTPREFINALKPMSFGAATTLIVAQASAGLVRAAARRITFAEDRPPLDYPIIPAAHWKLLDRADLSRDHFWDTGVAKLYGELTAQERDVRGALLSDEPDITAVEIRFEFVEKAAEPKSPILSSSVRSVLPLPSRIDHGQWLRRRLQDDPDPVSPKAPAVEARNAGGRPRKEFWEPLLIAVGIAVYGGFDPKKIADVERWMADWLDANGHDAGEVAIRTRARAFFNAYATEKDKN